MAENKETVKTEAIVYSLADIQNVVQIIKKQMEHASVFCLYGDLGAGKTTLMKNILASCGVIDTITSPTFTHVNIYKNTKDQTFYHFDLYRIHDVEEFLMMGFDEYLRVANSKVFIEWPEVIESLLKENVCHINLDYGRHLNERIINIV